MKVLKWVLVFIIQLPVSGLLAQTLHVFDAQTGLPVSRVLVYNTRKTISSLTTPEGKVNISVFFSGDTLVFQHPAYVTTKIPYGAIRKEKPVIFLETRFIDLDEIIISANLWKENRSEIPQQISRITRKDILLYIPPTSADMLIRDQAVYVQKSQLGGGSPMIRGMAANRILFVVDGVRMNNAIYRSGNLQNILQTDVNSIANTEIIFGPGTNIYGSDALGGVINFQMLTPQLYETTQWETHGNIYGRMGSAAFEKTLHTDINIANNSWGFLTSLSLTGFQDLRMGNHPKRNYLRLEYVTTIHGKDSILTNPHPEIQKFSGYGQLNFLQKVKYTFNRHIIFSAGFYFSATTDVPRYDRLTQYKQGKLKYAQWDYRPQSWLMARAGLRLEKKRQAYDRAQFIFAYQKVKEGRNDRKYRDPWLRKREEYVDVFSVSAAFEKKLPLSQNIYYGIDFDANRVTSKALKQNITTGQTAPAASRYPDGGTRTIQSGLYLSYKKDLAKIPLTGLAGVRLSLATLSSEFTDSTFYPLSISSILLNNAAITGNAGMVYRPGQWQFRVNLSSGFRAPNLDDVAKIFDSEPGNVTVPNQNLKPESLFNAEAGISRTFQAKTDVEITFFYAYLSHAMVRRNFQLNGKDSIWYDGEFSRVQAMVNTGHAKIAGISLTSDIFLFNHWGIKTRFTYIKGKDDKGNPLRHVPPLYGNISLLYRQTRLFLIFEMAFNGEMPYSQLAPSEKDKAYLYAKDKNGNPYAPSWAIFNVRTNYAFNEHFLFSFGIENLLNYRYRPYSSGISAPGLNITGALRYSF